MSKSFASKMVKMGWERAEAIPEIADIDGVDLVEAGRRYDLAFAASKRAQNAAFKRSVLIEAAKEHAKKGVINEALSEKYTTYRKAFFKEYNKTTP